MTKEQHFKREYAEQLLTIAEGDLESARSLASTKKGRPENICFHAQQAIEKALKAILCWQSKSVPFTHSIELILDRLGPQNQPPLSQQLIALTDFATVRRYQEGVEIISEEDIQATIDAASSVVVWAKSQVGSK